MLKYNSFLIIGHGRSGTTFLANLLNKSPTWTVLHEPNRKCKDLKTIQDRFQQNYYGEVNSYLRYFVSDLNVNKGVIIRNPYDILLSGINRYWKRGLVEDIENTLNIIENTVSEGAKIIYFDKMVSDIEYCQSIAAHFQITDIIITKEMMAKVNATTNPQYSTLPKELTSNLIFDNFIGKYLHD